MVSTNGQTSPYHKRTLQLLSSDYEDRPGREPVQEPVQEPFTYYRICPHCRQVYRSVHTTSQHCIQCAPCGTYKRFTDMAGKAVGIGYVCSECYASKPHVKQFHYVVLLKF